MLSSRTGARDRRVRLSSRRSAAGADAADALYVGTGIAERSGPARRARACRPFRRRGDRPPRLRRTAARRASPRPTFRRRRLRELVDRAVAMAREAPEDPYAGLAPAELLAARRRSLTSMSEDRSPDDPQSCCGSGRSPPRTRRSAVDGVTNSSGGSAGKSRRATVALATSAGFSGAYRSTGPQLLGQRSSPARAPSMQRDMRVARRAAPRRPRCARGDRPPRRRARRRPAQSGRSRGRAAMPVLFDPRVAASLLGHFVGAITGCVGGPQVQLPPGQAGAADLRAGRDASSTTRCADAGCARGRSTARACRSRDATLVDGRNPHRPGSPTAPRRGSSAFSPTGHAVRGVGGAPGAGPSNLYIAAGSAQPRRTARRISRSGAGDRIDRPGRQSGHRRL